MQRRSKMLDGIAPEAVDISDRPVNPQVFDTAQDEAGAAIRHGRADGLMNNFTATYAKAILAATRQEDLATRTPAAGVTPEQTRMERELESLTRTCQPTTFGDDVYLSWIVTSNALSRTSIVTSWQTS